VVLLRRLAGAVRPGERAGTAVVGGPDVAVRPGEEVACVDITVFLTQARRSRSAGRRRHPPHPGIS
jgi:hypothetical protein